MSNVYEALGAQIVVDATLLHEAVHVDKVITSEGGSYSSLPRIAAAGAAAVAAIASQGARQIWLDDAAAMTAIDSTGLDGQVIGIKGLAAEHDGDGGYFEAVDTAGAGRPDEVAGELLHHDTDADVYFRRVRLDGVVGAAGAVTAVTLRAEGDSIDVTVRGFTPGASYALDPDGTPKVVLQLTSPGFDDAGAATTLTRTIIATMPARLPWPDNADTDETITDGGMRVRLFLSEPIHVGDSAIAVSFATGWISQGAVSAPASNGIAVANGSTLPYPRTSGRWAIRPRQLVTGTFAVEAVAFQYYGRMQRPVRAVRFTVSDGVTTRTVLAKAMAKSAIDDLPVFAATFAATDFIDTADLACNFKAFPWVGDAAACLDSADNADEFATHDLATLRLVCDRSGGFATEVWVDNDLGNDGTGAVENAAAPFATCEAALIAALAYNVANKSRDDLHGVIVNLVGNGAGTPYTLDDVDSAGGGLDKAGEEDDLGLRAPIVLRPAPGSLTADTVIEAGTTWALWDVAGVELRDLTITLATAPADRLIRLQVATKRHVQMVRCIVTGTGTPATNTDPIQMSGAFGVADQAKFFEGCAHAGTLLGIRTHASAYGTVRLARGCTADRAIWADAILGCTVPDPGASVGNAALQLGSITETTSGARSNLILYHSRATARSGAAVRFAARHDLATPRYDRIAIVQTLIEMAGDHPGAIWQMSAGEDRDVWDCIFALSTAAGDRINHHNDTNPNNLWRNNLHLGLAANWFATKHDDFTGGPPDGSRTGGWAVLYGVGFTGCYSERAGASFPPEYFGRGSEWGGGPAGFVDDQGQHYGAGGVGPGGGDYHPAAGSGLLDRIPAGRGYLPWDLEGVARKGDGTGAAGAYEYVA